MAAIEPVRPDPAQAPERANGTAITVLKNGLYERIMRYNGGPDGTPSLSEKAVAVFLVGYARINEPDPRVYIGEERAAAELGVDRKTLRSHIDRLIGRGWLEKRRDQAKGRVTYYIAGLIRAFRDARPPAGDVVPLLRQIGKDSPTEGVAVGGVSSGSFSASSGNFPESVGEVFPPVRETFPNSLKLVNLVTELRLTHTEHSALAKRLGLDSSWFHNHPQRFAAAHQVVHHLDAWQLSPRRIKQLVKLHTFGTVAGAVGFVLARLERDARQQPLLGEEPVENPPALFEAALKAGWTDTLPGYDDDRYSPDNGGWSVEHDLWVAVKSALPRFLHHGAISVAFGQAQLRRDQAGYTVTVPTAFAAIRARQAVNALTDCFETLGFGRPSITISTPEAAP